MMTVIGSVGKQIDQLVRQPEKRAQLKACVCAYSKEGFLDRKILQIEEFVRRIFHFFFGIGNGSQWDQAVKILQTCSNPSLESAQKVLEGLLKKNSLVLKPSVSWSPHPPDSVSPQKKLKPSLQGAQPDSIPSRLSKMKRRPIEEDPKEVEEDPKEEEAGIGLVPESGVVNRLTKCFEPPH
ncbi:MAG TPA: hypothetical protein VGM34_02415 [Chlamydiales bacterium]